MRTVLAFVAACWLALGGLGAAEAKGFRHPATGAPAVAVTAPDDWSSQTDSSGNLLLFAPGGSPYAGYSITVTEFDTANSLDLLAAEAMKIAKAAPPVRVGDAVISGHKGGVWTSTATANGRVLGLKTVIVRLDDAHVASISLITFPGITPEQLKIAEAVLASVKDAH
jgi:hypothetical protein